MRISDYIDYNLGVGVRLEDNECTCFLQGLRGSSGDDGRPVSEHSHAPTRTNARAHIHSNFMVA